MIELNTLNIFLEDSIKILFIISTLLIIGMRLSGENRFKHLISFWNLHRYFYFQKDQSIRFFTPINFFGFFQRVIIYSIFLSLYVLPSTFYDSSILNFISISIWLASIIVLKFIIEKMFSVFFNYNKKLNEFNQYRIGLKNLISIHSFFYLIIIVLMQIEVKSVLTISYSLFIIYYISSCFYLYKKVSNGTLKYLMFFILYICTFEITPFLLFILCYSTDIL